MAGKKLMMDAGSRYEDTMLTLNLCHDSSMKKRKMFTCLQTLLPQAQHYSFCVSFCIEWSKRSLDILPAMSLAERKNSIRTLHAASRRYTDTARGCNTSMVWSSPSRSSCQVSRASLNNHHAPPCLPTSKGPGRDKESHRLVNAVAPESSGVMVKVLRVQHAFQSKRLVSTIQLLGANEVYGLDMSSFWSPSGELCSKGSLEANM
jgi:hypothetical protein